jgi:hypothetical protein
LQRTRQSRAIDVTHHPKTAHSASGPSIILRASSTSLYAISTTDPVTFALGALLLPLVALAAVYIPARRATRVDPVFSLKCE